jgi:hypothetical protein
VEKNWDQFTNNPKDYVLNNPWKTAGTIGLAGAAAYGAYEYYDSGKTFDVNTNQLGLGDK